MATRYPLASLPVADFSIGEITDSSAYSGQHPEQTAWKPAWQRYLGTYQLSPQHDRFAELLWYGKLYLAIGLPPGDPCAPAGRHDDRRLDPAPGARARPLLLEDGRGP